MAREVNQQTPITELRKSSRIKQLVHRFSPSLNYIFLTNKEEPKCYKDAIRSNDLIKWESTMKDEIDLLMLRT